MSESEPTKAPERVWINIPKEEREGVDERWWYEHPMAFETVEYIRADLANTPPVADAGLIDREVTARMVEVAFVQMREFGGATKAEVECYELACKEAAKMVRAIPSDLRSASVPTAVPTEWRCFHCDDVFTSREEAAEHFGDGDYEDETPVCIAAATTDKRKLVIEARKIWKELQDALAENESLEDRLSNFKEAAIKVTGKPDASYLDIEQAFDSLEGRLIAASTTVPTVAQAVVDAAIEIERELCRVGGLKYAVVFNANTFKNIISKHLPPVTPGGEQMRANVPQGWRPVEAYESETEILIVGKPEAEPEGLSDADYAAWFNSTHNCDAMGCGWSHVLYRIAKSVPVSEVNEDD